jgi:hypothetical protein
MTVTLARIEARHLARSPLLWLGVLLSAAVLTLELSVVWPSLAGDDLVAYRDGVALGAGALLAGAWLGLRDRATGAAELVAATPTAPWRLWRVRMAGVAVVAAAAFAALFAAGLVWSAVRGGRGTPDARLLADGVVGVVLGGWVGLALGRFTGSRLLPLLAAPLWVAVCFFGPMLVGELDAPVQRLSPMLSWEERSAVLGFLPDALWPHLGYLVGLVTLVGVLLLAAAGRDAAQRPPARPLLVAGAAGLALVATSAASLAALPDRLVVVGPGVHLPASLPDVVVDHPPAPYPDDGLAASCAGDAALSVCVYPGYGQELAGYVREAVVPAAGLLAGLPGVPTRVRMVPTIGFLGYCQGTEVPLTESMARTVVRGRLSRMLFADAYLCCALGVRDLAEVAPTQDDARTAVRLWALVAGGLLTREEVWRSTRGGPGLVVPLLPPTPAAARAAVTMADLPASRVRAELAPRWERLRTGALPVSELPGGRP